MTDNDEVPNTERDGGTARKAAWLILLSILGMAGGFLWSLQ